MTRRKKYIIISIIMMALFGIIFSIGIFGNPNFSIQDFCMNLASEIVGLVIALTIVEIYIQEKKKS